MTRGLNGSDHRAGDRTIVQASCCVTDTVYIDCTATSIDELDHSWARHAVGLRRTGITVPKYHYR